MQLSIELKKFQKKKKKKKKHYTFIYIFKATQQEHIEIGERQFCKIITGHVFIQRHGKGGNFDKTLIVVSKCNSQIKKN